MGLFRKLTRALTAGAMDFRPGTQPTAMYARQTCNAVRRMRSDDPVVRAGGFAEWKVLHPSAAPVERLGGWYHAPQDPGSMMRYWAGQAWSAQTRGSADM
jgi:hypothetical protein